MNIDKHLENHLNALFNDKITKDVKVKASGTPNEKFGHQQIEFCLQRYQESAISKQWAMAGGRRQRQ